MEAAGPYVDVIVYPVSKGRRDTRERAAAVRCSSDVRQRMNDRTSLHKFRRLMAANFVPSDLVVTLTYSDDALPATPELARDKCLKPFIKRLREDCRKDGSVDTIKYMYVTEGLHGDQRLHHHIVLPYFAGVRQMVRTAWARNGTNVDFETISARGYETWARYLTKEPRKTGRRWARDRMWTPSIGLKKPEVFTIEVDDDYQYEPPPGVVIQENEIIRNEWFTCQYVSYYVPQYLAENQTSLFNLDLKPCITTENSK